MLGCVETPPRISFGRGKHTRAPTHPPMMSDSPPPASSSPTPPSPPPPLAEATDAVPFFTLEGRTIEAKVVDNYDADTLRAVISLNGAPTKFSVRLVGIDTPEKRSRNDLERKAARVAHRALLRMLLGDEHFERALGGLSKLTRKRVRAALGASRRTVTLHCGGFDKYGRLLGRIETADAVDACAALVGGGWAKAYDGGTKDPWTDEQLAAIQ